MEQTSLRVIPECTGIFTLFIYLAAVLAYPATLGARAWGVTLGVGGVFLFSTARLVVLGVVGQAIPAWLTLFHMGLMVVANLGFALFLWLWWTGRVGRDG
jgi:exosortase/archaeosortase family protein